MKYSVKVRKVIENGKPLKAACSVTMDDQFTVHGVKVIQTEKGRFIAMPSEAYKDNDGNDFNYSDADKFIEFGAIIANTYGDRPEHIGVFSDSGHYLVLAAAQGTEVKVWDPMYKEGSGRYDVPGRKGKVRLDGTDAYADFSEIEQDCFERPYFLFWKE